jgi:DNA-binding CsgD family transcriptional regulator
MRRAASATTASHVSGWPDVYALRHLPNEYVSAGCEGIFKELGSGQLFILRGDKAYAVTSDPAGGNWRLAAPGDPSRLGQPVVRNARGEWELRENTPLSRTGRPSGGGTAPGNTTARERATAYLLTHRRTDDAATANILHLPVSMIREVAAEVDAVREAWRAATASGATGERVDAPLTPRERTFIDRWAGSLSTDNFAEMMQRSREQIDVYMRSDERRASMASSSQRASGSDEAAPMGKDVSRAVRGSGVRMAPEKKARVLRMLASNPAMSYAKIADEFMISPVTVAGLARMHGMLRNKHSLVLQARSGLFNDFILFPETGAAPLARIYHLSPNRVKALRREFAPIRANWNAIHNEDIADNRPELYASLGEGARQFIRQWGGRLSAKNLAIVMKMSESAIEAYRRSDEYRQFAPAPAPAQRPESPRPGLSGQQWTLTAAQKAVVLEWTARGMMPDSLSTYLSMLTQGEVPQAAIEAFIASPEYQHLRRREPPR